MTDLDRRQLIQGVAATAVIAAVASPVLAQVEHAGRAAMARAAAAFLATLDTRQRQAAVFPFDHEERRNWHYVPRGRQGNNANHVHCVWHDPRNNFGLDALRAHYDHGHHRRA